VEVVAVDVDRQEVEVLRDPGAGEQVVEPVRRLESDRRAQCGDPIGGEVAGDLGAAFGDRLDQDRAPTTVEDEVRRVGQVQAVPRPELDAPPRQLRAGLQPVEDLGEYAVLTVLGVDV
jgi:hypothetical protein